MSSSYRIEQAIRAASVLHKGQVRRGQTPFPYVTHLYAVAMMVADYTDDEDVIVGALLHDTLEDTDYTPEELQDDFGGKVMDLVLGVTEPKALDHEKKGWKENKKRYLKQLTSAPKGSLIIAAADKIHNMRCIVEEYYDNHPQFLADFGGSLEERLIMYQEISNILNRNLENEILAEFNHVFKEYKGFIEHVERSSTL
jgi:(p)ppGpp synthase/HD superfamily hydrolase